jgi:hypothetical protein
MRNRDLQRLVKQYLLQHLPPLQLDRDLLFYEPIEYLLRGFCFGRSGDAAAFYVWVFVQPLYIPHDSVYFNFGDRLSPGWSVSKKSEPEVMTEVLDAILADGLPFLDRFHTPEDIVDRIDEFGDAYPTNTHFIEAHAYSLILVGKYYQAEEELRLLHARCEPNPRNVEWVYDQMHRGDRVLAKLKRSPEEAKQLLLEWRTQTLRAIRLDKYAVPLAE